MKKILAIVIALALLNLAVATASAAADLSVRTKRLKITLINDIKADEKKVDVIKRYDVMERLKRELEGQLQNYSKTTTAEVEITGFRLRGGASGFFGFSGKDVLDGSVILKDKGKQIARFGIENSNGRHGKTQPPTRRLVKLIHRFGSRFANEAMAATGNIPAGFKDLLQGKMGRH